LKALLLAAGLALVFLAFLAPVTALAQNMFGGDPIADIKIRARSVSRRTLALLHAAQPRRPFAPDRRGWPEEPFATGLFADVAFRREGNT
jgi:hypothetical protein